MSISLRKRSKVKIYITRKADGLHVRIIDNGIGNSREEQEKLFQPFTQIDNGFNRLYEGTGLGLALVRKFVELHDRTIWVNSEPEKGSTFIYEIPVNVREG